MVFVMRKEALFWVEGKGADDWIVWIDKGGGKKLGKFVGVGVV